jgi:hypothetical protein
MREHESESGAALRSAAAGIPSTAGRCHAHGPWDPPEGKPSEQSRYTTRGELSLLPSIALAATIVRTLRELMRAGAKAGAPPRGNGRSSAEPPPPPEQR